MVNADKDLVHYGTLGMKWGIRRYQPYPGDYHGDGKFVGKRKKPRWERTYEKSGYDANNRKTARQATKRLNDLDQARAETERNYSIAKSKGQILKADAYNKDVESINKEIDRTIKKLNKGDMHVSSEDIKRNAAQGKSLVAEVFGGYLGKAIYKTVTGTWKKDAEGKKYKVDTEGDWFKKANEKEKSQYVEKRSNEMRKEEASRNTSNKINGHEIDENLRKISLNPLASLSASYSVNVATNTAIAELHARNKYEKQAGDMSALSKSDRKHLNKQINTLAKADVDLQMALLKQEDARNIGATTSYADGVVDRATTRYNEAKYALNSSIKTLKSANNKSNQNVNSLARVMRNSGMTYSEIAKKLGVSESTVWAMVTDEG